MCSSSLEKARVPGTSRDGIKQARAKQRIERQVNSCPEEREKPRSSGNNSYTDTSYRFGDQYSVADGKWTDMESNTQCQGG